MKFNPDEAHSIIGGRPPMKYMQGGYGFNSFGECLGPVNTQGEYVDCNDPSERESLEATATSMGISFRSTISDEKLAERIKAAQEVAE